MNPTLPSWDVLRLVMPEIWLVLGMCAAISVPFVRRSSQTLPALAAMVALLAALVATLFTLGSTNRVIFDGMLTIDPFSQCFKLILILFTLLVLAQWFLLGRAQTHVHDTPDFVCLLLGAAFGMALMASASNLLMVLIAIESSSLPSFALAGFRKRDRLASEGALKYVVFGAASSAIMVYGMSLIYGSTGTLSLHAVAHAAASSLTPLLAVGLLAMFAGIAFKLSAVPLHFWCPDVFQGAPIEVTTFLSVASKAAAVTLLVRVLTTLAAASFSLHQHGILGLAVGVAILGGVTATWGNLVALHQTNIKRLLAYSSIAHAGYMILAASLLALAQPGEPVRTLASSLLFYLLVYLFMNTGAFTVAAVLEQRLGSQDINAYAGLSRRNPALAALMVVFLLSLFGMPALGGFMGKIFLMKAMMDLGVWGLLLVAVLLFNTLLSLYYYARPLRAMYLQPAPDHAPAFVTPMPVLALLILCAAAVFWTGILPGAAHGLARDYATLHVAPAAPVAPAVPAVIEAPAPHTLAATPLPSAPTAAGESR